MISVINNKAAGTIRTYPNLKMRAGIIDQYLKQIRSVLRDLCCNSIDEIEEFSRVLSHARGMHNKVMLFGTEQDHHIISHANADFQKVNNLGAMTIGMSEIMALGYNYPYPCQLKEILKKRHFGKRDVLVGVQFEEDNRLLQKAFEYNYANGGINVLISNMRMPPEYTGINVYISSENTLISRDIAQIVLHFISANLSYKTDTEFKDQGARSFTEYCQFLLRSLKGHYFSNKNLSEISATIDKKLRGGNQVFTFGNGGCAAIASYVADALRKISGDYLEGDSRIFDVASIAEDETESVNSVYCKNDTFTRIIRSQGVKRGDMLLGFSSSGNSESVLHAFQNIEGAVRIGVLGFENGGIIGTSNAADSMAIVLDAGGFKSYQRAEDGQRIAMSSIINSMGRFADGKSA